MEAHSFFESISPHFFKIILNETHTKMLRIPSKFAGLYCRDFMSKPHQMVNLKVPGGEIWEVETRPIDYRLCLCKGWQEFVDFYGIKKHYFLVFKYKKGCLFHVLIFDETTTEINYPMKLFNTNNEEENIHSEEDNLFEYERKPQISDEIVDSNPPANNTVRGGRVKKTQHPRLKGAEKDRALERASSFKSRNPYFPLVMQPSYINRPILNIPRGFFLEHMSAGSSSRSNVGKLFLSDGSRSWTTKYLRTLHNNKENCKITSGWKEFAKDNSLKLGDVCVFELLKSSLVVFRVTIFRGTGDQTFHATNACGKGDGECSSRSRCPNVGTNYSGKSKRGRGTGHSGNADAVQSSLKSRGFGYEPARSS